MSPETESDLAEAVRTAPGPLRISGGGTRSLSPADNLARLSTAALSGIRLYEPGALTLVAAAGTPVAGIEAALAAEGQRLAFEPMDHRALLATDGTPTIGGVAAANVSGPRRVQAGACRDHLLGLRFVTGEGEAIQAGGRVMKNVTGYDLTRLLAGSHGTLGVITEVALKVLPATETTAVLRLEGLDVTGAVAAMTAALATPFEVTGAAHLPACEGEGGGEPGPVTLLRLEGFADSVAYRAERLRQRLSAHGEATVETDAGAGVAAWQGIRDVADLAGRPGDVWRIAVRPTDAPRVAAALPGARLLFDRGGGLVWALVAPGTDIRPALAGIPGHARRVRAAPESFAAIPAFPPEPAPVAALSAGLRCRFDPRGILNPGAMSEIRA